MGLFAFRAELRQKFLDGQRTVEKALGQVFGGLVARGRLGLQDGQDGVQTGGARVFLQRLLFAVESGEDLALSHVQLTQQLLPLFQRGFERNVEFGQAFVARYQFLVGEEGGDLGKIEHLQRISRE